MGDFNSKAIGNWEAEGQTTWEEVGHPQAGDSVTIKNTHTVTLTQNEACGGLIINAGGILDIATFNLVNSAAIGISGKIVIGNSADTGLTTAGMTFASGADADLQTDSDIYNSGAYSTPAEGIFTNNYRGVYRQTGTATIQNRHSSNTFLESILAMAGTIATLDFHWYTAKLTTLTGTLAGGNAIIIKAQGNDFLDINAASTISVDISVQNDNDRTQKAIDCVGFTGGYFQLALSGNKITMTGDWNIPNTYIHSIRGELDCNGNDLTTNIIYVGNNTSNGTLTCGEGTITCNTLRAYNNCGGDAVTITPESSTIIISADLYLTDLDVWTKATETVEFTGGGVQNATFNGFTINKIIVNKSGNELTCNDALLADLLIMRAGELDLLNGVTSSIDDFECSGGTLQSDSSGNQATLDITNDVTITGLAGVTFAGNNPVTITSNGHNLSTGDIVGISGTSSAGDLANGSYVVTVTDPNNFTVPFNGTNNGGTCNWVKGISRITFKDIHITTGFLNMKDKINVDSGIANTNTNSSNCDGLAFFKDFLIGIQ